MFQMKVVVVKVLQHFTLKVDEGRDVFAFVPAITLKTNPAIIIRLLPLETRC